MTTAAAIIRNAIANFALPIAALVTGPLLARALGVEDRGVLAAVLAALTVASFLAPLGMQESIVYGLTRRLVPLRDAVRVSLEAALVFGMLAAGLVAAGAPLLLPDNPAAVALLRSIALLLPLLVLVSCLRGIAQARHRFDLTARERWVLGGGRLALIVPLFLAGALTVETAAWASAGLPVLAMLALLPAVRARGAAVDPEATGLSTSRRTLLGYSSRSAPGTMLSVIGTRIDQLLMAPLAGVAELGLYAVAVSLAEIPLQGTNAVRDVVFATSSSRGDPGLIARTSRVMLLVSVPVSLAGVAAAPVVLPLLFGDDFADAVLPAQVLLLALVPLVTGSLFVVGLLGLGKPGLRSRLQLVANLVQLALLVALVPAYGAVGAAVAVLLGRLVATATFAHYFARNAGVRVRECLVPRAADLHAVADVIRRLRAQRRA